MKNIFALMLCLVMLTGCSVETSKGNSPEVGMGIIFILGGALAFAYGTFKKHSIKNERGDEYVITRHYAGKAQFSGVMTMLTGLIILIIEIKISYENWHGIDEI